LDHAPGAGTGGFAADLAEHAFGVLGDGLAVAESTQDVVDGEEGTLVAPLAGFGGVDPLVFARRVLLRRR